MDIPGIAPALPSPAVPVIGETPLPAHGVVVLVTPGTGMSGATPAPPSSVAPSGIVPPLSVVTPAFPGVESGEAVPKAEAPPAGTDAQPAFDPDPVKDSDGLPGVGGVPAERPAIPPPSNVEFVVGAPSPKSPADPVLVPATPVAVLTAVP